MVNNYALTNYHYKIGLPEKLILALSVLSLVIIYLTNLDFIITDFIYEKTSWKYTQSFWAETIMHKLARMILIALYVFLVFKLYILIKNNSENHKIYDLFILLITIIISIALVSTTKQLFNVDCPWDLIQYGGEKPFYSLFSYPKQLQPSAHCFPASHASVGFGWIALYFYFQVNNLPHKYKTLITVLFIGFSFGVAQQIRGAHFISHDITSLTICLLTSMFIYSKAYKRDKSYDKN